jgi:hypothetical protein
MGANYYPQQVIDEKRECRDRKVIKQPIAPTVIKGGAAWRSGVTP